MIFKMNTRTFDPLLSNGFKWFDIVVFNIILDQQQTIGVYNPSVSNYDKETKTISHYEDVVGTFLTDGQIADLMVVKGNTQTRNKEISRAISRLEKKGFVKRCYTRISDKKTRYIQVIGDFATTM